MLLRIIVSYCLPRLETHLRLFNHKNASQSHVYFAFVLPTAWCRVPQIRTAAPSRFRLTQTKRWPRVIDTPAPLDTILAPMRFPLPLTAKIAAYVIGHKLRGTKKFATVLQLEPLHTCNLTCTGCGRIREYSTSLKDMMSLEDCLGAAKECNAPMVSICGGEPLIYPHIEALVQGLLAQNRIVYICNHADQRIRRTSRKCFIQKGNLMARRHKSMPNGIGNAFIKKKSEDWPRGRHAAMPVPCLFAASMSASVRLGYSLRMAAVEYPASRKWRIVATLIRVPEITSA